MSDCNKPQITSLICELLAHLESFFLSTIRLPHTDLTWGQALETLAYPDRLSESERYAGTWKNITLEASDCNEGQTMGERPMNKHERVIRLAEKSTKAANDIIERGIRSAEVATNGAKLNFLASCSDMRELNIKLIDMAHANVDAVFDFAREIASVQTPSDLAGIWSSYAKRRFEMMTEQLEELTAVGQKIASRNGGSSNRL